MDSSTHLGNAIPEYLYHYTTVDTLAMILKTKKIRLNPLNTMDDLTEGKTHDLVSVGNYIFVSSWTKDSEESIPMWNMYAGIKNGVRIKMRSNPFKNSAIADQFFKGIDMFNPVGSYMLGNDYLPIELKTKGYIQTDISTSGLLRKVEYFEGDRTPSIISYEGDKAVFNFNLVGSCKSDVWAFQQEWRYVYTVLPIENFLKNGASDIVKALMRFRDPEDRPNIRFFDFEISDQAFRGMEVIASPEISAGNREILRLLKKEHNGEMQIIDSKLTSKIHLKQL